MGKRQAILALLVGVWAIVLTMGVKALRDYSERAGDRGPFSLRWPQDSLIKVAGHNRPLVVMFLHPECSCSRASLEELDRVLAHAPEKPEVYAVFVVPKGWSDERAKMALWLRASRMDAVTPVLDRGGQEATRFGAATSGQVYAYAPTGELVFAGGITPQRAHEGDNPGRDALATYLADGKIPKDVRTWKVFGCALFDAHHHVPKAHPLAPAGTRKVSAPRKKGA